jgi:2,3-bisphosphoglycerate-dependent phosphoglycerate mutase
MKLFIIRHAESANNRLAGTVEYDAYMAQRFDDPPLTELGERQAERLAVHTAANAHPESREDKAPIQPYSGYGFTHLYCSPMLRSLQTAEPVARTLGLRPEVWVDIHEHGGIFTGNPRTGEGLTVRPGLSRQQVLERFPEYTVPDAITGTGWWNRDYEDMPACLARAMRVARILRRRAFDNFETGADEAIALISHGTFIDSLLKAFSNQLPEPKVFYQHYNTAITRVDFMPDGMLLLRYLNRTQHLPPEMFSV